MIRTLMIQKVARMGVAASCVAATCWWISRDAPCGLAVGSPASVPVGAAADTVAKAEPKVAKELARAVFEMDSPQPSAKPMAAASSKPTAAIAPREGVHVYVTVDGRAEDFGTVFVRSREGRHFAVHGGVLGPAQVEGRYIIRMPGLPEPPQAHALGDGREVLLVLRPEVERVIQMALDPHAMARAVSGVLSQRSGIYIFEIKEVFSDADSDKPGMGNTAAR